MDSTSISRFWDNYISKTISYGVAPKARRWYVRCAEAYINAHSGIKLSRHTSKMVNEYFESLARKSGLIDWQFIQTVNAVQILFTELVKTSWSAEFPWDRWKTAAEKLPSDHATIARVPVKPGKDIELQNRDTINNKNDTLLEKFQYLLPQYYDGLITQIRVRQYSIRTEQSYQNWIARFLAFNQFRDPAKLGASEVSGYLEHLVVNRNVAGSTQNLALNAIIFFSSMYWKKKLVISNHLLGQKNQSAFL